MNDKTGSRYSPVLIALAILGLTFGFLGCSGGGGGGGSALREENDRPGISRTVGGFMQALRAGNPESFLSPRLQSIAGSGGGTLTLWDFGFDIHDPADDASYTFSIPEDGIRQLGDDYAQAYAVAVIAGHQIRIDFQLIRDGGVWYIEDLDFSSTSLVLADGSRLLPLAKGNDWSFVQVPINASGTLSNPSLVGARIESDPLPRAGHSVFTLTYTDNPTTFQFDLSKYEDTIQALSQTGSWEIFRGSLPAAVTRDAGPRASLIGILDPASGSREIAFANQLGLYLFGSQDFQNGGPVRLLDPLSAVGFIATTTVSVRWTDGTTYQMVMGSRLSRHLFVQTMAGGFNAFQLDIYTRFTGAVPSGQELEGFSSLLFAEDIGPVAEVIWDGNAQPLAVHLLHSAQVGNRTIFAVDEGTGPQPLAFLISGALPGATVGQSYSQTLVTDGTPPYALTLTSGALPMGLALNGGVLSGTPNAMGSYAFGLQATDAASATIVGTFSLTVSGGTVPTPLAFAVGSTLPDGTVGATYSVNLGTGGTPPYAFSLQTGVLPGGLGLTPTGLSGTPTATGAFSFDLLLTDAASGSVTGSFTLSVVAGGGGSGTTPLAFGVGNTLPDGAIGASYSVTMGTGGTPPYAFAVQVGSLPAGLGLTPTGLSGTPTASGPFSFDLLLTDAAGTSLNSSFNLMVNGPLAFAVTTPLATGTESVAYSLTMVTGGVSPYTFNLTSGSLPPGLSFGALGLTGTPNTPGQYFFSVQVTDSASGTVSNGFDLAVVPPLAFARTSPLPQATVGLIYTCTLATGGASPYTLSLASGSLPPGLSLSTTALFGTPTAGGNYSFGLTLQDSLGNTVGRSFDHSILQPLAFAASSPLPSGILGSPYSVNLATGGVVPYSLLLATGSLPAGLNFDATGLSGTPSAVGSSSFGVSLTDASGTSVARSFDLGVVSPLALATGSPLPAAKNGLAYSQTLISGGIPPYSLSLATGSIPAGMSLLNDQLNGTASDTPGTYSFGILATDSAGTSLNGSFDLGLIASIPGIVWQRAYGSTTGTGGTNETAHAIRQTSDGGYITAGWVQGNGGNVTGFQGSFDVWVVKVDANGAIQWQKSLGGSGFDYAYGVYPMANGNFAVVGKTNSVDGNVVGLRGGYDLWVVMLDSFGNLLWQKCLGGTNDDQGYSILENWDGELVVAGSTFSSNGDVVGFHGPSISQDMWVAKLASSSGNIIWQKPLGGTDEDEAWSIDTTADSGFIVAGHSNSLDGDVSGGRGARDFWVVKLDGNGTLVWQKMLGGTSSEYGKSVQELASGGFVVAGYTSSNDGDVTGYHSGTDMWVTRLDATGGLVWQKALGGTFAEEAWAVNEMGDGSFLVAGAAGSNDGDVVGFKGNWDAWAVKLNPAGSLVWQKPLGGSASEKIHAAIVDWNGDPVLAGHTNSTDGDVPTGTNGSYDFWLLKLR